MASAYTILVHLLETLLMCWAMRWVFVMTKISYNLDSQWQQKYRLITNIHVYKKKQYSTMMWYIYLPLVYTVWKNNFDVPAVILQKGILGMAHMIIGVCYLVKYWGGCLIRGRKNSLRGIKIVKLRPCVTPQILAWAWVQFKSIKKKKKVAMELVESLLLQEWRCLIAWKKLKEFTFKAAYWVFDHAFLIDFERNVLTR